MRYINPRFTLHYNENGFGLQVQYNIHFFSKDMAAMDLYSALREKHL